MKNTFLFLLLIIGVDLNAQVNPVDPIHFFDPEQDPIALRSDSSFLLLVSEYTLVKSVQTRLGQGCQVLQIMKTHSAETGESLVMEGIYLQKKRQPFVLYIPLQPDAQGRLYYASTQALICSSPGCNNCSILNGHCVGCCSNEQGAAVGLPSPLIKVQTKPTE